MLKPGRPYKISYCLAKPTTEAPSDTPGLPNSPLHSDPARIAFRSLSAFRYLGFAHCLGAGVAA